MNSGKQETSNEQTRQLSLRLVPGIIIVILQWLIRFALPAVIPGDQALMIGVFGGLLGGLAIAVWWAFFSRAPRVERWGAIVLMIVTLFTASRLLHVSIATANMGMMFIIFSIPVMSLAFVIWAITTSRLSKKLRYISMVVTIICASGVWTLLQTEGMTSNLHFKFAWRWAETNEERFLEQKIDEPMALPEATESGTSWTGFRGTNRDGIIHGIHIKTDWKASPPVELWRRPVGPGCSSFAVEDGLLYTQEQLGDDEAVTCYNLSNGKPVWIHRYKARFWDSHAGSGPRATPTINYGRLYTFGATGILNVYDSRSGTVIWSRNAATDTGAKDSGWGFTGSPLVVDSLVIVAASGELVAYNIATGKPSWYGPDGGKGYSSPHLLTIDEVPQIVLLSDTGAISLVPSTGKILWEYPWPQADRILQPAITDDGDLLLSGSLQDGVRRIEVTQEPGGWNIRDLWTSTGIKPYFNDFVIHKGHAYGFDGLSLACISIEDGRRIWRGGRYGGQIILLADQDLILVLTERGELAIVTATPDKFTELARIPALDGKTWNHPVLVDNVLVVRNSQEMVAFRLPLAVGSVASDQE
jgi:outer membrane protein assembly factor BamB